MALLIALSPLGTVLIVLLCPLLAFVVVFFLLPRATVFWTIWCLSKLLYRIRLHGTENVPREGPALLLPNHVSWLDGVLVQLKTTRHIRMMVYAGNFKVGWLRRMADQWGAILIDANPKSIVRALNTAREALNNGELVCMFPEGGITRNAQTQSFKAGPLKVLKGTGAPVIPIYLDGLWGSLFSFERKKFFWKWPRRLPYPVDIYYGQPIEPATEMHSIRQAVVELGAHAVEQRKSELLNLPRAAVASCKRRVFQSKVADSSGTDLSGANFLMRTLILHRLLRREVIRPEETHVGLLLPPTVAAVATNLALAFDRRVSVNLNYTVSSDVMNECIAQAGIKNVLTSRRVMEKMDFDLDANVVYLEDLREAATLSDKLAAVLMTYVLPTGIVASMLKLNQIDPDDVLTVIFTSGSTGVPKGVMLTHANIASNVLAIEKVIHLGKEDVIIGVLPFFHSFGYTVTLWCVAALNVKGAYHFSPLDARQVGTLCAKHKGTILLATPTFLRSYTRRCSKEEFATLDTIVAGAEKLPLDLCDAFESKFGVRPVEGYGTTELSPLVSVNVPPSRSLSQSGQTSIKEGTVGRTVPGVAAKIVHTESGEELGAGESGMLMIKGANVMKGYLKQPEKTAEVVKDGWYVTGDIAEIDNEGFIRITGRESRFSKIGGEMVPHIQIEETLQEILGTEEDAPQIAVTAVPHAKKGERLIVVHSKIPKTPSELCAGLKERGLPNIFIPSEDSFREVDELPILGTGKLDLKALKQVALDEFGPKD